VIQNGPERFFWEHNPNPSNPDHGNRLIVLEENGVKLPVSQFSYNEFYFWPVIFSKEKLQKDFQQFRNILEETHPALYDYTDKQEMDSVFDANAARIEGDLDFDTFLMLMTEVIAKVGCGHSSLWIPGDYWSIAPQRLFPLDIQISGDRVFVAGNFNGASEVAPGSRIIEINGEPVEQIVDRLRSLTSADGFNPSYRTAMVEKNFAGKFARAYGQPEKFLVRYRAPGGTKVNEASLRPVNLAQIQQTKASQNELSLKEMNDGHTALLTINSFGYYGQVDRFRTFLDSVFQVIDQKQIQDLVLDLRGNSGGDPFCASYLWAYLQPEPQPYFEDHYGRYDTLANPVPMAPRPFKGNLYTLIDGRCFSTTGHFVGLLKYHGVGKFVGSESGATYTCTGNATYPALDETGIMVGTARVMRYTAAVKDMDPRRGVIPDYPVEPSVQDIISDRDVVLEHALQLIQED
jgi:C-terminal processing protease CtpA/Prc